MNARPQSEVLLEHLFRHQAGRIVAHLTRLLGPAHLDLAEETVQEAMVRALQTWPYQGMPENPAGWLFRVAHNAAIDALRRDQTAQSKADTIAAELARPAANMPGDPDFEEQLRDDELRMIFMCCHPEIPRDSSVALSLKAIGGFNVREIARAFLEDEPTIAQRLVRAKRRIRSSNLTLDMPHGQPLRERLDSVLEVIYFVFNEGYSAHEGEDLIRRDLCLEALRLARLIASSSMSTPRAHALVAFLALQAARIPARTDEVGDLILFEDQDRSRWDQRLIALGFHHFDLAMAGDEISEYHAQAAIAATHTRACTEETIQWEIILQLYDQLFALNSSPIVALNRAVVISKVHGPAEALAAIEALEKDSRLRHYHPYFALLGRLYLDLDRRAEAATAFREALECRCSEPERRFLRRKLAECGEVDVGQVSDLPS